MNTHLMDAYDLSGAVDRNSSQASLNEEVSQVVGQLGKLWGGFRKQSVAALESAKKVDLSSVVTQAQKELTWLVSDNPYPDAPKAQSTPSDAINEKAAIPAETPADTGRVDETSGDTTPPASTPAVPTTPTQTFLSRLQSSIPPNLVSTVQSHLPETLKNAPANLDLGQLRSTLTSEFARVQGVTRAQAEEYAAKSQGLLREAVQGAGEFFKDAVKVVPPEEAAAQAAAARAGAGLGWDGMDGWMMDVTLGTGIEAGGVTGKGKEREVDWSSPLEAQKAVATRAQALLRRLKYDPEVLRADPVEDKSVESLYTGWLEQEVDGVEGGMGGKKWATAIEKALAEPTDGEGLKATLDTLVPSDLKQETFWTRYFFRVYQVQGEEERRKALLQGSINKDEEEELAWEDDEDDTQASVKTVEPATTPTPLPAAKGAIPHSPQPPADDQLKAPSSNPQSQVPTPATMSPRHSSESSYDLVSSNVSAAGEVKVDVKNGPADVKKAQAESDDEDEEDEEDEEGEEGEEEEEDEDDEDGEDDSDWE